MPAEKNSGALVYAGTINQSGALEIRADRLGHDTTFGKIIEAVERAERSRAPIQRTADRLAGYLVYFALGAAALTLLITHNARSTISVIIVAGACGIAAGTPLAVLGAIGRAAREGSIIKGGLFLELLSQVDTVIFDKTGTLTFGQPEVIDVIPADGVGKQAVLETAAVAERRSEHPLAKAVVRKAVEQSIALREASEFRYTPGKGITSIVDGDPIAVGNRLLMHELGIQIPNRNHDEGATEVLVARRGSFLGTILIADNLRTEAVTAVQDLKRMGLKILLLTGDSKAVAESVAKALGVSGVYPELLPEQKLQKVAELIDSGRKVAMLGDGINDAPHSPRRPSVWPWARGQTSRGSADIVLIGSDLTNFVETVRIARRCMKIIMQNFYGTIAVDTLGVLLAACGMLNPLLAAFIHVSSELTFILNSTRMLPRSEQKTPEFR
jgi:heavy metal translocating P-type ATPase